MKELSKDDELVIKKADKGGAIVIWGKDTYVAEAHRQLNTDFYQRPTYSPTESLKMEQGSGWTEILL